MLSASVVGIIRNEDDGEDDRWLLIWIPVLVVVVIMVLLSCWIIVKCLRMLGQQLQMHKKDELRNTNFRKKL